MAYDVVGEIVIIPERKKKLRAFALKLLKHKRIKSVYARGKISGRLRVPKLRWIAGKRITETIHRESRCLFKLDIKKCYFSPRLASDRLEIAKKVKRREKVLVLFSGVAPYPLVIAKNSKARQIYGIELSKVASRYAVENVKLNKISNVVLIQGDVKKVVPKLAKKIKFNRIIIARPQLKESFLKEAFLVAKKGTIIHFYDFLPKEDFPQAAFLKIKDAASKARKKIKVIGAKIVREIAPYTYHVRIDFKLN